MKHHALPHHPIVVRHGRRQRPAVGVFEFCARHFLLFPTGAAIAIVWANLAAESYFKFAQTFGFLVNNVGMAFFFALIAQEVVEAVMPGGALHSWRRWGLPIVAAAGGIIGAALTYVAWVHWKQQLVLVQAWPVACAMDIALAYYVLKSISRRSGFLPFVLLLGIATNLFGVVVMALQGPPVETRTTGMVLVLVALGLALLLRASRVPTFWPYVALCGTVSWWAFYWIGIHPALAFLPIVPLLPHEPRKLDLLASPPDDDATHHFEHEWHNLVQIILFFFGLVNAGVLLGESYPGTWALLAAAIVGRPVGVLAAIAVATMVGMHLPPHIRWRELVVMSVATSGGFAFALFLAAEILPLGPVRDQLAMGALLTVIGAAITYAVAWLLRVGRYGRRGERASAAERASASEESSSSPEGEAPWHSV
jgi:Na+:H+ antiporter, NhaA family